METIRLGSTGMTVSRICLGCMGFVDVEHWVHKLGIYCSAALSNTSWIN